MMEEILRLLRENNAMLKEILSFLKQYKENDDMRQFSINVTANLFTEIMEDKLKDKLKNNFKK